MSFSLARVGMFSLFISALKVRTMRDRMSFSDMSGSKWYVVGYRKPSALKITSGFFVSMYG